MEPHGPGRPIGALAAIAVLLAAAPLGEGNPLEVFFRLAAGNAAAVVRALLRAMPESPGESDCARRTAAA